MRNIELVPKEAGLTLGRHEQCDIMFPPDAEKVSRFHARIFRDEHGWQVTDLGSRWGTFLNGYKINHNQFVPISEGDLLRITPWTFSFSTNPRPRTGFEAVDDSASVNTFVRQVAPGQAGKLQDDMLVLLLEAAAGIHGAEDEKSLAEVVLDEACRGSGLPNTAWLRPVDAEGRIEVVSSKSTSQLPQRAALYSRTLLQTASQGVVAELTGAEESTTSESIVANRINAAICVPLMLGQTVAAYLYLDARGGLYGQSGDVRGARPNAAAFCLALGRIAGLALSNLKRKDIEQRHALIQADLHAGAEAQRWILPKRQGQFGSIAYIGESRPGLHLGGDFFDVIPLGEGKLAVTLGDVTGKGVAASVLMTTSQGFLHAALLQHGDPKRAVMDLSRFIYPRRPEGKFVTLWVGVFDTASRTLRYVDAGHGHALLARSDGSMEALRGGGGLPVGIMDLGDYDDQLIPLPEGGRALIVSDGIIEQFCTLVPGIQPRPDDQFGINRTGQVIAAARANDDAIARLFDAVIAHAGCAQLADDATAVLVTW